MVDHLYRAFTYKELGELTPLRAVCEKRLHDPMVKNSS